MPENVNQSTTTNNQATPAVSPTAAPQTGPAVESPQEEVSKPAAVDSSLPNQNTLPKITETIDAGKEQKSEPTETSPDPNTKNTVEAKDDTEVAKKEESESPEILTRDKKGSTKGNKKNKDLVAEKNSETKRDLAGMLNIGLGLTFVIVNLIAAGLIAFLFLQDPTSNNVERAERFPDVDLEVYEEAKSIYLERQERESIDIEVNLDPYQLNLNLSSDDQDPFDQ